MKRFKVTLIQEADDEDLDREDIEEFGEVGAGNVAYEWTVRAKDADEALDLFHLNVPIALLETYWWEAEEVDE